MHLKKTPLHPPNPQPKRKNKHLHGVSNAEASSDDGGHIKTCISNLHLRLQGSLVRSRVWHDGTGGWGFGGFSRKPDKKQVLVEIRRK